MVSLNKKQVKVLLDIMKSADREALKEINIKNNTAYCTNGYIAVAIKLTIEPKFKNPEANISYDKVEKWYKLSSPKDEINENDLNNLIQSDGLCYPDMEKLLQFDKELELGKKIIFNANYLKQAQEILKDCIDIERINDHLYKISSPNEPYIKVYVMGMTR